MRSVPSALASHLNGGVTTLCMCWKAERADGTVLGFTDHDHALTFDGVTFDHVTGFSGSAVTAGHGLAISGQEIAGAFAMDGLDETDLRAGLWDAARVEFWLVNWQSVGQRLLLGVGHIGEVRSEDGAFSAEIRGLAHQLDQPRGRIFARVCDANLGDQRCGVDLSAAGFKETGTVTDTDGRRQVTVSGLGGFDDGWFTHGMLTWTSGDNQGAVGEIKAHRAFSAVTLHFWQAAGAPIQTGDTFEITAGCDKRLETCRAKFSNVAAFRGFPHIPGNDFVLSYPAPDGGHDGGKRGT